MCTAYRFNCPKNVMLGQLKDLEASFDFSYTKPSFNGRSFLTSVLKTLFKELIKRIFMKVIKNHTFNKLFYQILMYSITIREMIFLQLFCSNFLSHTHILFLFYLYSFYFCVNIYFSL
ncbi:hypothetical protein MtrunA17_Chr3g0143941 [Medicago truncatula]|uniref:Transmembrane protein, putative n=1 Tax=Medicago truncatula TaxID=3880 RepID=A0A072V3V4_MEDTR|nr:transmembrane protein, putative [Medicago truncatula]RHN71228.1 hypothetical protein MtrunA17_Chr3g0143941 [Medicago truncatula]